MNSRLEAVDGMRVSRAVGVVEGRLEGADVGIIDDDALGVIDDDSLGVIDNDALGDSDAVLEGLVVSRASKGATVGSLVYVMILGK